MPNPTFSVILPAYNEEVGLELCAGRVLDVLVGLAEPFEIIVVDDGSNDATWEAVLRLHHSDSRIKGLRFSRNFGHQSAIVAGLAHASGAAVITLDADLQHPPELLPEMAARWRQGFEIVVAVREETEGAGTLKRWTSSLFYWLFNLLGDTRITPNAADFRLLDRKVVTALSSLEERSLFLRGLIGWMGFRQTAVSYRAGKRLAGTSKYSFGKMVGFALDGITSYSAAPLRLIFLAGWMVLGFVGVYTVWILFAWASGRAIHGWASVLLSVLFLGGMNLIAVGVMGEYLARIFQEVKRRPLYLLTEKTGEFPRKTSDFPLACASVREDVY